MSTAAENVSTMPSIDAPKMNRWVVASILSPVFSCVTVVVQELCQLFIGERMADVGGMATETRKNVVQNLPLVH